MYSRIIQSALVLYRPHVKHMFNTKSYFEQTSLILCLPEVLDLVLQEDVQMLNLPF